MAAKKGIFNNPIAPKERLSSANFAAPTKEQATTGHFMPAGDYYGTGFRAKVGSERVSASSPIPRAPSRNVPPKSLA